MGGQTATQTSKDQHTGRSEERSQGSAHHITGSGPHADMLELQHAVGNRAVSELVQSGHTASRGPGVPPIVRAVLKTTGQPLDPAARAAMEARFGHDFSQVRVHTDTRAAESARAVSARAFTVGRDIVFAEGQYQPSLEQGRKLLAHELTHTIQQSSAASAAVAPQNLITVEPADTALERTAEESASRPTTSSGALAPSHGIALQRAPADEPSMFAVFVADERKRKDTRYARSLGKADAARIRKSGTLSLEDRQEVNAKLRFFDGEAWEAYREEIRPALAQVTQPEIDMSEESAPPIAANELAKFTTLPTYIDNDITKISFFGAEQAIIYYKDGSSFELGLVPKWMKPPVVEVDYHTPREDYRPRHDAKEGLSFIRESDLQNVPRSMSWPEVLKRYSQPLDFFVQPGTGRVVPSRVNMLTAPNLCYALRKSEQEFVAQSQWAVEWGTEVAKATAGMGGGNLQAGRSLVEADVAKVAGRMASRRAASREVKQLTEQLDDLLKVGGSKPKNITVGGVLFEDVVIARQGSRLAVRRFRIQRVNAPRGHGRVVSDAFEDAAVSVARMNGLKTVTIDVGIITNPGWRVWLESLGYVYTPAEGGWIKTIKL